MDILIWVRTLVSRFFLFLIMFLYLIPFLLVLVLPKKWFRESTLFFTCTYFFYWLVLKASFLRFNFIGRHNIPDEPSIIIANHESSLDIPIIGYLLNKHPHTWLATTWLMKSPILRFILPQLAILVDTSSAIKGMRSLLQVIKEVNGTRQHIVIFPEGGRFTDGKVHDFFSGFVILAKKMGRPVVPIKIFNLNKVYPPNSFLVYDYPVKAIVGEPFIKGDREDDASFKKRVHDWFIEQE